MPTCGTAAIKKRQTCRPQQLQQTQHMALDVVGVMVLGVGDFLMPTMTATGAWHTGWRWTTPAGRKAASSTLAPHAGCAKATP
jgi:hypothetical protein